MLFALSNISADKGEPEHLFSPSDFAALSAIDLLKGQDEILEKLWRQIALATSSPRLTLWQPDFESAVLAPKQKPYNLALETLPCNSICHLPRKEIYSLKMMLLLFLS